MDKKSRDLVMGKLFLKNKDYKMAEKSFSEYLSTNPEDYQALKMLAQVQEHLNDTAKAFDLYQRCYLAQPDRKGVLLDVCRLLLIKDSRLDHVDQKKWLKLAAQSFPTNPIVTNLRESMPNSQDSHPGRITTEDLILEKLTSLEDRFRNFEDRIKGIEDKLTDLALRPMSASVVTPSSEPAPKPNHNSITPKTQPAPKPAPVVVPTFQPVAPEAPKPVAPVFQSITPEAPAKPVSSIFKPIAPEAPAKSVSSIFKPVTPEAPAKPVSSIFKPVTPEAPAKSTASTPAFSLFSSFSQATTAASTPPPQSIFSSIPTSSASAVKPPTSELFSKLNLNSTPVDSTPTKSIVAQPVEQPKPVFGQMPFNTSIKSSQDPKEPAPADGGFTFPGVNLFAESLKKMNLPAEGAWGTSPKPAAPAKSEKEEGKEGEYDADDNDSEAVNNEELPIESFCDMKPIEIKSGEEDEDIVFEFRCKLFRFRDKEYKERGLGNIKVLKHRETGKGRLIMRREQINLVCLNCWSCTKIERVRDTQVRFAGLDASDGEAVSTIFLAKFGTQEKTDEFMKHLQDLFTED